jgi:hypothetical protein
MHASKTVSQPRVSDGGVYESMIFEHRYLAPGDVFGSHMGTNKRKILLLIIKIPKMSPVFHKDILNTI